jgi:hypothetical protein
MFLASLTCFASSASADIVYDFTINTSFISGTAGSLDFNFNPGPLVTQPSSLQILSFMSDGTLGSCTSNVQTFCNMGDVTGTLPGTLTFDNGTAFNDYFTGFTFGNSLSLNVRLFGPAINSPDGASTSGSAFAFSMFSDAAGTTPTLTSDLTDGFAATIDVNPDGTTTVANFSSETTIQAPVSAAPEPNSLALMGAVLGLIGGLTRVRQRRGKWYKAAR